MLKAVILLAADRGTMRFGLIGLCLLATLTAANAEELALSTRVCIVPVANGVATEADVGDAWRMVSHVFDIPGLPGPVFTPTNRKGAWTIIKGTYQPYEGPFPMTFFDGGNWVHEPWSEVVVATRQQPGQRGVWIVAQGDSAFEPIPLPGDMTGGISEPFLLPRQQQTVIIIGGLPFIVRADGLKPWRTVEQMTEAGLPGLSRCTIPRKFGRSWQKTATAGYTSCLTTATGNGSTARLTSELM